MWKAAKGSGWNKHLRTLSQTRERVLALLDITKGWYVFYYTLWKAEEAKEVKDGFFFFLISGGFRLETDSC